MWIVLIDCSGSMGEGFEAGVAFEGKTVVASRAVKLDAAREAIVERLAGLNPSEPVALVAFNSRAWLVFEGTAAIGRSSPALGELVPEGGTDLAAAFDFALDHLRSSSPGVARVLVVSDCKTEVATASASADRLAIQQVLIDVLLIDPSEQTLAIARAVVRHGEVQAVAGAEELKSKLSQADREAIARLNRLTAHQNAARERARQALQTAHKEAEGASPTRELLKPHLVPPSERPLLDFDTPPCFSVGHDSVIAPGKSSTVYVVIHRPEHTKRVKDQLRDALEGRSDAEVRVQPARCRVPLGSTLEVELSAPELEVNPGSFQHLRWEGMPARCRFVVRAGAELLGRSIDARVRVYFGDADLVDIPITFMVGLTTSESLTAIAQPPESVFLSYSRADRIIVDRCRGYWEKLGISVYQDTRQLENKPGHDWSKEIEGLIFRADAFKLFWSDHSAESKPVENEWRYAWSLMPPKVIKPSTFIRPLCWSEFAPKLPSELSHMQISMLESERAHDPRSASKPVAVVPLLANIDARTIEALSEDVRVAAAFVQERTGLACDPPPLLIVDEHATTRMVESGMPTEGLNSQQGNVLWAAMEVVQALALDLHVEFRKCLPGASASLSHLPLATLLPDIGPDATEHARRLAEFVARELAGLVFQTPCWQWDKYKSIAPRFVQGVNSHVPAPHSTPSAKELQAVFDGLVEFGRIRHTRHAEPFAALRVLLEDFQSAFGVVVRRSGDAADYRSQYGIPKLAASCALELFGPAQVRAEVTSWDPDKVCLSGPVDVIARLFGTAASCFLNLVEYALASRVPQQSVMRARNYAVYTPGDITTDAIISEWAVKNGVPDRFTLRGSRRIVLALTPLNETTQALSDSTARELLRRGVIVHELWHAAVDAARLATGLTVSADAGRFAEEGVALWLEADHARANAETHAAVLKFVDLGVLPEWPYAAMHVIERDYAAKGLSGVYATVELLRSDPKAADEHMLE